MALFGKGVMANVREARVKWSWVTMGDPKPKSDVPVKGMEYGNVRNKLVKRLES